jgi:hypothetical protein
MLKSMTTQCSTAAAECVAVLRCSSASRVQDGWTPLIAASFHGHVDIVKALIEGRADLEAKDKVRMDGARIRRGGQGVAIQTDTDGIAPPVCLRERMYTCIRTLCTGCGDTDGYRRCAPDARPTPRP